MSVVEWDEIEQILGKISGWPKSKRLSLASKILQSVEAEPMPKRKSFADLIGLWEDMPSVTDEDLARILDEERMRKYG